MANKRYGKDSRESRLRWIPAHFGLSDWVGGEQKDPSVRKSGVQG